MKTEPKSELKRPEKLPEKDDRPVKVEQLEIKYGLMQGEDEAMLKELLTVDEQYTPLLVLVSINTLIQW